jgi:hypothetical protein
MGAALADDSKHFGVLDLRRAVSGESPVGEFSKVDPSQGFARTDRCLRLAICAIGRSRSRVVDEG